MERKIKNFRDLVKLVSTLKAKGKRIVHCHGIFDIIHPGVIQHIESAKKKGDILVVTVVRNKDVNKGPGHPIFDERLRAENVASITYVDFVSIVDDNVPFECVKILKPDIFARGQDYKERDHNIVELLKHEEEAIKVAGCKVHYTPGVVSASTSIISQFLDIYPEETKLYLKDFQKKYNSENIIKLIKELNSLSVLVIGDAIIDEYHYCESMGKSLKEHLVVNKYLYDETFAGGALAVANHIAGLCKNVQLVTILGKSDSKQDFILNKLRPNIKHKFFYREGAPTIIKKRFINEYLNQKLFEICYINNDRITQLLEKQILNFLAKDLSKFDLILISDFGHGIITNRLIDLIQTKAEKIAINVQANGANMGYNLVTKYRKINFACIDETEARLACQDRHADIKDISKILIKQLNADYLIVTQGSRGSVGFSSNGVLNTTPAFSSKVIDRIGAGDAFFAFTSPCFAKGLPLDLVSFIGNAVGAIAVQIVCNREPVEPKKLFEFIYTLLR